TVGGDGTAVQPGAVVVGEFDEPLGLGALRGREHIGAVTMPPGPVPGTRVRSMPRSLASLRTGGLARTRTAGCGSVSAPREAPACDCDCDCDCDEVCAALPAAPPGAAPCAVAVPWPACGLFFRGRRLAEDC